MATGQTETSKAKDPIARVSREVLAKVLDRAKPTKAERALIEGYAGRLEGDARLWFASTVHSAAHTAAGDSGTLLFAVGPVSSPARDNLEALFALIDREPAFQFLQHVGILDMWRQLEEQRRRPGRPRGWRHRLVSYLVHGAKLHGIPPVPQLVTRTILRVLARLQTHK